MSCHISYHSLKPTQVKSLAIYVVLQALTNFLNLS